MRKVIKIISGAQTGADRGGLNAAIVLGLPYAGFVPKGRKAEDGTIPETYQGLTETPSANYIVRTRKNAEQADATLIFTYGELTGGSLKTAEFASKYNKPWLHVDLNTMAPLDVKAWIQNNGPSEGSLNIAGSRGSKAPGLEAEVEKFLLAALEGLI